MRATGLDTRSIVERTGLSPYLLDVSSERVPDPVYAKMWREARRIAHSDAIGAAAGAAVPPGMLGPLDYLASSAATLGESISCTRDFNFLVAESSYWEIERGAAGELSARFVNAVAGEEDEVGDEFAIGLLLGRGLLWASSPAPLLEVQLTRRKPLQRLNEQFSGCVSYGHSKSQILLGKGAAQVTLKPADPCLHVTLRALIDAATRGQSRSPSTAVTFRDRVRDLTSLAGASLAVASRRLGLSERSLQRKLRQEGTSFEQIIDEERRMVAISRLAQHPERSLVSVALDVGFADERAFARAFRRWTGQSPREWRRAARAKAPE